MTTVWYSDSEASTRAVGQALAPHLAPDGILLLSGDLGSGKTELTRGLAQGLGVEATEVQSPTFTLIREHRGNRGDLVHIDLYRLEGRDLDSIGLWEVLAGPGVKAIEWAERLTFAVPDAVRVSLEEIGSGGRRKIEIEGAELNPKQLEALTSGSVQPV